MALFSRKADDPPATEPTSSAAPTTTPDIPIFGARGKARELAAEVTELRAQLDELGALEVVDLERQGAALTAQIQADRQTMKAERQSQAATLEKERQKARQDLDKELAKLASERDNLQGTLRS